jgi:dolichol-phosphate mannosyltransferase
MSVADSSQQRAIGGAKRAPNVAPELTVVIPCHDEEANLEPLFEQLTTQIASTGLSYEIVLVDDGSRDGTVQVVRRLMQRSQQVTLLRLVRNFGHQSALLAGLAHAKGSAVICMDADLQHPPRLIPDMVKRWRDGALVVQMIRSEDGHENLFKSLFSAGFYWAINRLSKTYIRPNASDFILMDQEVVRTLLSCIGSRPFLRGLIAWLGYPTATIEYVPEPRFAARPSYTLRNSLRLATAALISNSHVPLRLGIHLGFLFSAMAALYVVVVLYAYLVGAVLPGWTSVIGVVLIMGGVQLFIMGLTAQYIGAIFDLTRRLPNYIVMKHENQQDDRIEQQSTTE